MGINKLMSRHNPLCTYLQHVKTQNNCRNMKLSNQEHITAFSFFSLFLPSQLTNYSLPYLSWVWWLESLRWFSPGVEISTVAVTTTLNFYEYVTRQWFCHSYISLNQRRLLNRRCHSLATERLSVHEFNSFHKEKSVDRNGWGCVGTGAQGRPVVIDTLLSSVTWQQSATWNHYPQNYGSKSSFKRITKAP